MTDFELAKLQVIENTKRRNSLRIDLLIDTANKELSKRTLQLPRFDISNSYRQQLISGITAHISNWVGGKYYTLDIKTVNDWYLKVRVWWNRGKAIKLGNDLFASFMKTIVDFIRNECKHLNERVKLSLFLDIFISILSTQIKFKRSKPRPLIPHQIFTKRNNFKTFAETFITYFDYKWTNEWNKLAKSSTGKCYIANKNRSSGLFLSYLQRCKHIQNNFIVITDNINKYTPICFAAIWNIQQTQLQLGKQSIVKLQNTERKCTETSNYNDIIFALAHVFMENNTINGIFTQNQLTQNGYNGVHGITSRVEDVRYQPLRGINQIRLSNNLNGLYTNSHNNYCNFNVLPF
eukprot:8744_1